MATKRKRAAGKAGRKAANRKATKKQTAGKAAAPARRAIRPGFISHTEIASADPEATVAWCREALGWKFPFSMPTPDGPYHMWDFGDNQGGGIGRVKPAQQPGGTPFVEMRSIRAGYDRALKAGATPLQPPSAIPGGSGWIAVVSAPGGVPIGLWAPKE